MTNKYTVLELYDDRLLFMLVLDIVLSFSLLSGNNGLQCCSASFERYVIATEFWRHIVAPFWRVIYNNEVNNGFRTYFQFYRPFELFHIG